MSYLCLDTDIPPSGYQPSLDGNLLIFDNGAHVTMTALNRCRHRGFPLADAPGRFPLRCGYHGLPFHCETPKPVLVRWGMCFDQDSDVDTRTFPHNLPRVMDLILSGDEFHKEDNPVACQPWRWAENTMDLNHVATVHRDGFANSLNVEGEVISEIDFDNRWSWHQIPVSERSRKCYISSYGRERVDSGFIHWMIYPNLSITSFLDTFFSVETWAPSSAPRSCRVLTRFFVRAGFARRYLLESMIKGNSQILAEDRRACEAWEEGAGPEEDSYSACVLAGESRIRAYKQWRAADAGRKE